MQSTSAASKPTLPSILLAGGGSLRFFPRQGRHALGTDAGGHTICRRRMGEVRVDRLPHRRISRALGAPEGVGGIFRRRAGGVKGRRWNGMVGGPPANGEIPGGGRILARPSRNSRAESRSAVWPAGSGLGRR